MIPGYAEMSRPQKFRARRSVKQVRRFDDVRATIGRDISSHRLVSTFYLSPPSSLRLTRSLRPSSTRADDQQDGERPSAEIRGEEHVGFREESLRRVQRLRRAVRRPRLRQRVQGRVGDGSIKIDRSHTGPHTTPFAWWTPILKDSRPGVERRSARDDTPPSLPRSRFSAVVNADTRDARDALLHVHVCASDDACKLLIII